MRFIIVALALMAMFSTASGTKCFADNAANVVISETSDRSGMEANGWSFYNFDADTVIFDKNRYGKPYFGGQSTSADAVAVLQLSGCGHVQVDFTTATENVDLPNRVWINVSDKDRNEVRPRQRFTGRNYGDIDFVDGDYLMLGEEDAELRVHGMTFTCAPCPDGTCSGDCPVAGLTQDTDTKYKGCFKDFYNRIFNHLEVKTDNTLFDKSTCETACKGYFHYGIQWNGKHCFCGLSGEDIYSQGTSTECKAKKGGNWVMDVWEVEPSLGVMTYDYADFYADNAVGCYEDKKRTPNRIFKKLESTTSKSMKACDDACIALSFDRFGLQYHVECWCGNAGDETKYGPSTNCHENGRGGNLAMMVYKTTGYTGEHPCDKPTIGGCAQLCTYDGGMAFVCSCPNKTPDKTYSLNSDGKSCDEHKIHPCDKPDKGGCDQVCNKNGDISECACDNGYTLDGYNQMSCKHDVCDLATKGGCDQVCNPDGASYKCACNSGTLSADMKTCE